VTLYCPVVRSLLFCNEMLGLGHLRLSLVLADALTSTPDSTALVVTGSPAFGGLRMSSGVDILKLPTAPVTADSRWSATAFRPTAGLGIDAAEIRALRMQLCLSAVERFQPDVVVSDQRPLGREEELKPALEHLRQRGRSVSALGLWDVDDAPERLRLEWTLERMRATAHYYDLALVYGAPMPDDVRVEHLRAAGVLVRHTGMVSSVPAVEGASGLASGYLLATAGGGVDGFDVLAAVIAAIRVAPIGIQAIIVTGPLMSRSDVQKLREEASGLDAHVFDYRSDMEEVIAGARAIVAMAGYCTVSEVLASGKPALLVPRMFPRQEQFNRARYIEHEGQCAMLPPDQLDPKSLRDAIEALLICGARPPQMLPGATTAAAILTDAARKVQQV